MNRERRYDKTILVRADDTDGIKDAADHLKNGEVVAFPTETVYGLGANAFDAGAVDKIYEAKGRPGDNPLIVHIFDKSQIDDIALEVTPLAGKLIDAFMPGPITVIVRKKDSIPDKVTAGLDTVGIRMPSDAVAHAFLQACGCPVAAPSANLSGSPSPTSAAHVMNDMDGFIYAVVDGGDSVFGLESTVVDATGSEPVILRPGAVTKEDIDALLSSDTSYAGSLKAGDVPPAPGMKYRHYAPSAAVEIIPTPDSASTIPEFDQDTDLKTLSDEDKQAIFDTAAPYITRCREIISTNPLARVGILAGTEVKTAMDKLDDKVTDAHVHFYIYGKAADVDAASHSLFAGLRHLDLQGVDYILAAGFPEDGIGKAYMNRLGKAALKKGEVTSDMPDQVSAVTDRGEMPVDAFENTFTASVLFVSEENRALSFACEAILTDLLRRSAPYCAVGNRSVGAELYSESAGLYAMDGDTPDKQMVRALDECCGIRASHHLAVRATPSVYDNNDLIIAMHDDQAYEIVRSFPEIADRVFSISSYAASKGLVFKNEQGRVLSVSIPDPKGENYETYCHTAKALKAWLDILFPYIIKDLGAELI